jgi:outer membrane protein assembly factor BamB
LIVGGFIETPLPGDASVLQVLTIKYRGGTGTELWRSLIQGSTPMGHGIRLVNFVGGLAIDAADNPVVAGELDNLEDIAFFVSKLSGATGAELGHRGKALYVAKLAAATGSEVWHVELDASQDLGHRTQGLAVDSQRNVIVTGELVHSSTGTDSDALLLKLAAATGGELWRKQFQGTALFATTNGAAVQSDDSILLTGYSRNSPLSSDPDFFDNVNFVIAFDQNGTERWRHEEKGRDLQGAERATGGGVSVMMTEP